MKTEANGVKVLTTKKDGSPQFYVRLFDRPDFIKDGTEKKLWITICKNRIYFSKDKIISFQKEMNTTSPYESTETPFLDMPSIPDYICDEHVTVQIDDKTGERCKLYIYTMEDSIYQKIKDYEGGYDKLLYSSSRQCYYIAKEDKTDVPRGSRLIDAYYKKNNLTPKEKVQKINTALTEIAKNYKELDGITKIHQEVKEKNSSIISKENKATDKSNFGLLQETVATKLAEERMIIIEPVQDKSFKTIMNRHLKNLDDMSSKLLHELIDNPAEVPGQEDEYDKCLKYAMNLRNMIRRMRNEGNDT